MLMQYVWEHRLWLQEKMVTNTGLRIRIIDPGVRNTDAGPDFFNAKIEIDGCLWVGNVEIHNRASDWRRHGHNEDEAYDSVVLHVVNKDDAQVCRTNGEPIPQLVMPCSAQMIDKYSSLVNAKVELPCRNVIKSLTSLEMAEWIQALAFERLAEKSKRVTDLLARYHGSWEDVCYVTLARTIGFGTNSDPFERLAKSLPLNLLHKHADSLTQLEALFFGQAGLLDNRKGIDADPYRSQLCREYDFLNNKFSLKRPEGLVWKAFRMRPQNFPWRRIALLAHYVYGGFRLMSQILEAKGDEDKLRALFTVKLSGYWSNHYTFDHISTEQTAAISRSSIDVVLINTVVPLYYTYAQQLDCYDWAERAVALLEVLKPESNHLVEKFRNAGMRIDNALTSQAVIQLNNAYCVPRKCLYCEAGHKLLSLK